MKSEFKICRNNLCSIKITGLEELNGQYLKEGSDISFRNYEFLQSITLNVIKQIGYNEEVDVKEISIVHHTDQDISEYTFTEDGLHEVSHMIIPTKEYINRVPLAFLIKYTSIYYYNLEDGRFYKRDIKYDPMRPNSSIQGFVDKPINVKEIIEIDAEDTTIIKSSLYTFCICYLQECLYRINKNLINELCGKCVNKINYSKEKVINRDLILMSLHIIKYLIDFGSYLEAQRVLESISQCGNICKTLIKSDDNGCRCG